VAWQGVAFFFFFYLRAWGVVVCMDMESKASLLACEPIIRF
jgi:hypothetical protein